MKTRNNKNIKLRTSLSLSKTKPLKAQKIKKIQRNLSTTESKSKVQQEVRLKPKSRIEEQEKLSLWLYPARFAFFFNGLYFLLFSIMAFLGVFSNYQIIKPFFTLPFDTSFSSFFLLEIAAMFSFLASLLYFHAARHPRKYRWFYFFIILFFIPYHFLSNLRKLQIELPRDFQNYLTFDTIVIAIFWVVYLLSIYTYLKTVPTTKSNTHAK